MNEIWSQAVQSHQEGDFPLAKKLYEQFLQDAKDII